MNAYDLLVQAIPIVAAVSLVLAGWLCLPEVLKLTQLHRFRNGVRGGPEAMSLDDLPRQHAGMGFQLLHMGFRPLGVYWETDDPRRTATEYVYTSSEEGCYATLYGFGGTDARVSFITVFGDGAQIHTKNFSLGIEADLEDLYADGIATNDLTQVLARHRGAVARFTADGHPPGRDLSMEEYVRFQIDYYYHANNYPEFRKNWQATLMTKVGFLGICFGVPYLLLGRTLAHPTPWLVLLAGCLLGLIARALQHMLVTGAGLAGEGGSCGDG